MISQKFLENITNELTNIENDGLFKRERIITSQQSAEIEVAGKKLLNFCANNYLGLSNNPEVMKEKPRAMGESILTKPFLTSIGVEGLCIGIMTMTAFMIGYRDGNAVLASTMAFGTLCSSRLVHGFNCKANKPIIFTKRFWNNIYLIGAFVLGWLLITGVLMIPALQGMFKVQTLTVAQLMTVYGLALLNLPVIQLLKWIRRRKK